MSIKSLNKSVDSFLESSYYKWPYLFNADYAFENSFRKPRYLSQTNLDGSYIELTKEFYNKFTMFNGANLICPRTSTTAVYEVFWEISNNVNILKFQKFIIPSFLMNR